MNRERSLVKNTLIISFGTFLPKLLAMISLPILTAELTKSEYGTYDLISVLESLFLPCITLQIQTAAFRFLIECREEDNRKKEIVTNVISFVICTSAIGLTILYFCLKNLTVCTRVLICLFFFFYTLMSALQQIARGIDENILYSLSTIVYSVVNVVLIVICVEINNLGLNGSIIALAIAAFISAGVLSVKGQIFQMIDLSMLSRHTLKELIRYSWPMIPNSLSMWVMNLSDRLVLTAVLGVSVNALYAVANKIPSLFSVVQSTFTLAWQENASLASADYDSGEYYGRVFDTVFNMMVGIMALLISCTPILYAMLIRGDYSEAYNQMPILFLGVFFSGIASFLGGIYVARKRTQSVGFTTAIGAIINLSIDLMLVRRIGVYAASLSTLISYLVLAIYRMIDVQKIERIEFHWYKIVFMIVMLMAMCFITSMRSIMLSTINIIIAVLLCIVLNRQILYGVFIKIVNKIKKK